MVIKQDFCLRILCGIGCDLVRHPFFLTGIALRFGLPVLHLFVLAACLGDLFTYCVTSVQLGLAHPAAEGGVMASVATFLGIFAVTQVPLAIVEGLLSVAVILALESYASGELSELAYANY